MSEEHGITAETLLRAFPLALRGDPSVMALAQGTAQLLAQRPGEIDRARLYANIDQLPEETLDILAYDFKVDWWDPNYTLEEKRRVLKDSWNVHRHLGTRWAVETAVRAIYPKADAQEWFEYPDGDGEPYHFRMNFDMTDVAFDTIERRERTMRRVWYYKNLRSHCDAFRYTVNLGPYTLHLASVMGAQATIGSTCPPDDLAAQAQVRAGGAAEIQTEHRVPEDGDALDASALLRAGGAAETRTGVRAPEDQAPNTTAAYLRYGGVTTILAKAPTIEEG